MPTYTNKRDSSSHRGQEDCKVKLNRQVHKERQEDSLRIVAGISLSDLLLGGLGDLGGSIIRLGSYPGHRSLARCPLRYVFLVMFFLLSTGGANARGEDFAQPPEWSDEVKGVFFDDARQELKGEPPKHANATSTENLGAKAEPSEQTVWRELISPSALESAVKATTNRVAQSVRQPTRFKAGLHNECRRDFTLLGTLFEVIGKYPADVRWKADAPQLSQLCMRAAESCAVGSEASLQQASETLIALEEQLRGQTNITDHRPSESSVPEFAPLMQFMETVVEDELPQAIGKQTEFRRSAVSIGEKAQLLAMLSQVIRGEEYGYADDETYQTHADRLRDAAKELNEAATAQEFEKAVQAMAGIQKACADCHADYRG